MPSCRRGSPWYCFATHNATQKMTLADGTVLSPALGIGAFVEKTLVAAGQCTKVDPRGAGRASAGLLGCGVMAGLGAAMQHRRRRAGRQVAVFGCGGVGDAAIAGARAGRRVHDHRRRPRRPEAGAGPRTFGATHTVNAAKEDPVEAIQAATGGNGADVCIEAIGLPADLPRRPSTPATSPAPSCWSACPGPT